MNDKLREQFVQSLIHQVLSARPEKGSELNVRTVISRTGWREWCKFMGDPIDCEPTQWMPNKGCRRVYGSETIVVDEPGVFAVSFPLK